MTRKFFMSVVAPMMGVAGTVMIGISSPQEGDDHYSLFMDLKWPNGEPLFHVIHLGLACQPCMDAGKGSVCPHKRSEQPAWKPNRLSEMLRILMGDKDQDTFEREQLGMATASSQSIYRREWVKRFMERPLHEFKRPPRYAFVTLDPSGGGAKSAYAMQGLAYDEEMGRTVVSVRMIFR